MFQYCDDSQQAKTRLLFESANTMNNTLFHKHDGDDQRFIFFNKRHPTRSKLFCTNCKAVKESLTFERNMCFRISYSLSKWLYQIHLSPNRCTEKIVSSNILYSTVVFWSCKLQYLLQNLANSVSLSQTSQYSTTTHFNVIMIKHLLQDSEIQDTFP
jgi:hypothetical protein